MPDLCEKLLSAQVSCNNCMTLLAAGGVGAICTGLTACGERIRRVKRRPAFREQSVFFTPCRRQRRWQFSRSGTFAAGADYFYFGFCSLHGQVIYSGDFSPEFLYNILKIALSQEQLDNCKCRTDVVLQKSRFYHNGSGGDGKPLFP